MSTSQHQSNKEKRSLVLNLQSKDREQQQIVLNNKRTVIGSNEECTVVLAAQSIKPVHCMVIQGDAGTIIRNFCSDTRVNGSSVGDTWFQSSDTLSLGGVDLRIDGESACTPKIESRSEEIIDLVARLGEMENQIGLLKESNADIEKKAFDFENQLSEKLSEVSRLEEQNSDLTFQLDTIQRELPSMELQQESERKTDELEATIDQKNKTIEQFAERNSSLAREIAELREQITCNEEAANEIAEAATSVEQVTIDSAATESEVNNVKGSDSEDFETEEALSDAVEVTVESIEESVADAATNDIDDHSDDPSTECETDDMNCAELESETDDSDVALETPDQEFNDGFENNRFEADNLEDVRSFEDAFNNDIAGDFFVEENESTSEEPIVSELSVSDECETESSEFETAQPENSAETPLVDPFKVLEMIDNARTNEIEHLSADESESTVDEFVTDQSDSNTTEPVTQDVGGLNSDSWEASFRKEFRDELANKAAAFSPKSDGEVDEEKREEIASSIAKVENELAHLFRPSEDEEEGEKQSNVISNETDDSTDLVVEDKNETELFDADQADTLTGAEASVNENFEDNESFEDTGTESVHSEESESSEENTLGDSQPGELDFDFELAESNLADAFSDLSMETDNDDDSGVSLEFSESSEDHADNHSTDFSDETTGNLATEWQIDSAESQQNAEPKDENELEDIASQTDTEVVDQDDSASESPSEEFSQEQADDFLQAAMEAENTNPYASFLDDEEQAEEENSAILADLGINLDSISRGSSEEAEPGSDQNEETLFSEIYSQELENESAFDNSAADENDTDPEEDSSGLLTSSLFEQSEADEADASLTPSSEESVPSVASEPAQPASSESSTDDSYIQEYMKRLLGNDEGEQANIPVQPVEKKPESPSLLEKTFEREIKERQELLKPSEFVPKTSAPEKSSNLQAMRDLANQSARSAIETSTRKKKFEQQSTMILVLAGISFFVGASLAMLSTSPLSLTGIGSVIFFAMTGFGAWYYFDLRNSQSVSVEDVDSNEEPETKEEEK